MWLWGYSELFISGLPVTVTSPPGQCVERGSDLVWAQWTDAPAGSTAQDSGGHALASPIELSPPLHASRVRV